MPTVYLTHVSPDLDCAPYLRRFPQKRRAELARKTPAHRILSVCGGLLLLYGLRRQGWSGSLADLQTSPNGKPYFPGSDSPRFNLSHSGGMVVCALSAGEVGVDIETERSGRDVEIAELFHPLEREWLASLPSRDRIGAFYALWTHKESYMKFTGLGAELPLESFSVRRPGTEKMVPGPGCAPGCSFHSREIPGYHLALCRGSKSPVSYRYIEFAKLRWEALTL